MAVPYPVRPAGSFSNARVAAALSPSTSTMSRDGAPRAKEMVSAAMRHRVGDPAAPAPRDTRKPPRSRQLLEWPALMPLPSKITFVTFDVYGTLIDWETGVYDAFKREAVKDGFTIDDRDEIIPRFHEYEREIEGGSYELYAEVLRRVAVRIAKDIGWPLEPSRAGFLPDSVQRWPPFKETNPQLKKFGEKFQTGLISNIDDKLLGLTRRHIPFDFDLVVTAQQVRSYKPDPAHFTECARRMGTKKGWVHIAASYYHDVEPCLKQKVPVIWVNRNKEELDSGQKKPTAEVKSLLEAAKLIGAA